MDKIEGKCSLMSWSTMLCFINRCQSDKVKNVSLCSIVLFSLAYSRKIGMSVRPGEIFIMLS